MSIRKTALGLAVAALALPASAGAAQQSPVPLTGEILYMAEHPEATSAAQCTQQGDNTTFTLHVDDGFAIGPYPGTFDENVTVTLGPGDLGLQPFPPFDLPPAGPGPEDPPIPGTSDIGAQFFPQRTLVNVQATFNIETVDGRTVTGSKTYSGTSTTPVSSGTCDDFDTGQVAGYYKDVRAYDLEYEARIHTDAGTFVDEGSSTLTAREAQSDPNFFRFDDFLQTFASSLGETVELKPGLGCGDLNHGHERAGECRNQQ